MILPVLLKSSIHSIRLTFGDFRGDRNWDKTGAVIFP